MSPCEAKRVMLGRKQVFLFSPLLILIVVLLFLSSLNDSLKNKIKKNSLVAINASSYFPTSYPLVGFVLGEQSNSNNNQKDNNNLKDISAESYIVMDDNSKVVLLSKNENFRFPLASTTKIMTALVALDYFKLNDILTVKTKTVEGSVVGFETGEKFYLEDMLYAMLLPSGNDAALTIAQNYIGGGETEFVEKMNEKAKSLNLYNTHFSDTTGLSDDQDYTTVIDLARLSSIAIKNPVIKKITSTKQKEISTIDGKKIYSVSNLNKLLGVDGINGIKTGYTDEAGGVLATSKTDDRGGGNLIIVVMKSQDRFSDTQKLVSLIGGKISYIKFNHLSIHP